MVIETRVAVLKGDHICIPIYEGMSSIGSSPSNKVQLDEVGVSHEHALIDCNENEFFIQDLGSTNRTFIKSKMLVPSKFYQILDGDRVSFGPASFTFEKHQEEMLSPLLIHSKEEENGKFKVASVKTKRKLGIAKRSGISRLSSLTNENNQIERKEARAECPDLQTKAAVDSIALIKEKSSHKAATRRIASTAKRRVLTAIAVTPKKTKELRSDSETCISSQGSDTDDDFDAVEDADALYGPSKPAVPLRLMFTGIDAALFSSVIGSF
jgi:hypothetical protein